MSEQPTTTSAAAALTFQKRDLFQMKHNSSEMLILWTAVGVLGIVGVVMGQSLKTASGCVAMDNCSSFLSMSCSENRRIFILKAQFGHKSPDRNCASSPSCSDCCTPGDSDCFSNFSITQFSLLYDDNNDCWNRTSCQPRVQQGQTACGLSTFAVTHYSCLRDGDITDFHRSTAITAPAVAVHYDSSDIISYPMADTDSYKTWHCQVDTTDSVQRQTDVILVRESHEDGLKSGASSLGWSGGRNVDYLRTFQYTSFNVTTPFNLSVRVGDKRNPDGWAVVRTQDGSNLTVRCGNTDDVSATSTISAETGATPSTMLTTNPTEGSNVLNPTADEKEGSQKNPHLGVTVAGWVVAAVLSVCLAVVICRLGGCKGMAQLCSKGPTTSGHLTSSCDQAGDDTYLEVIPDSASPASNASSTHAYVNATGDDTTRSSGDRSQPQPEYSPLDWSRDSANAYSQLG